MPIHLWTQNQADEWLVLDGRYNVIDRGVDLADLRRRHEGRRLTFVLIRA